ncbi:hypothetical protein HUW51_00980 (plasmid) [Adhaeribacter swui]|uniref:Lipoprotein n=1 Tax=Adhaeribacter swui TaxID=2086471 RepID=A0A7G7G2H8_9BACT|nr:hypothetical protein [Adhaeribacter swui]QNF31362.1 hypothetical protein HUW51_00980 [Adhaeribacter swui]
MKTLNYLFGLLFFTLFLAGCSDKKDDPDPVDETATFRVDFSQSGDYQKFTKILTISGGEFKYRGTNDIVPAALIGDDLNTAGFSVEASNVRELKISALTDFSPVEDAPATMTMKFSVFRNGTLLEEKTFTYTDATKDKSEDLTYKAK